MEVFLQALVNGILLGGFYSLMGMGQNIIFGVMNIVNFCHGEMLMVGMYITYVLYTYFGVDPYVALPIVAVLMFGLPGINMLMYAIVLIVVIRFRPSGILGWYMNSKVKTFIDEKILKKPSLDVLEEYELMADKGGK